MRSFSFLFLLLAGITGTTWVQAQNTECAGTSMQASDGTFSVGYNYSFTTNGGNVTAEFQLLDPQIGLVAYAQTYNPNFAEVQMNGVGAPEEQTFTASFPGQVDGTSFNIACKFAFAGGLSTTAILTYTVGSNCSGGTSLNLPIDFESTEINYELQDFGGNASSIVDDPTDPSNKVVQSIKTIIAEDWAGTTVGDVSGFAQAIPFAPGATSMSVRVWSPVAGIPVRLKVEQVGDPGISVETETLSTEAMVWETLVFDFSNEVLGTAAINFSSEYNKASIFFNFGTSGLDAGQQIFFWDNMEFIAGATLNLPVNFENPELNYGLVDFGGNQSQIIVDPTDANNMVVESIKTIGAATWAGTTLAEGVGFENPIPFAPGATLMTVRVWSPTAGIQVRLKAEALNNTAISVETEATTSMASQWETLTFNFANQAAGTAAINFGSIYSKVSIFFNFGVEGTGLTYYWDDVEFGPLMPPPGELNLPLTFEDSELNYGLVDFGGNASEIVVDPTDPDNMVVQSVKTAGAELWAGTTVAEGIGFATPIPFAPGATQMTVRVWSPLAGIPVRLKAEALSNQNISVETEATTTLVSQWETLTFNFANQAEGTAAINFASDYRKVSIFFNFGIPGAVTGEQTYYWDDVAFGGGIDPPADGLVLPVTFEEEIEYGLVDFGGNASERVVDPTDPSNMVVQSTKTPGAATWAGTTLAEVIGFASQIPFAPGATSMTIRVWSPTAGIQVRLKAEHLTDPAISVETEATTTLASQWETLTFNFANQAEGTAAINFASMYRKVSIFFNFGVDGTGLTYYWDDVTFGEGTPPQGLELPVTFEEDIDYMLVDFGGNASDIVVDPTDPNNKVAVSIKTAGAELWAGTTVGGTVGFTSPIPFVITETRMNVRVWSPTAGTPVRLKVEAATNSGISVETEAITTVAMQWETLEFDFANEAAGTAAINLANAYNKASIFFNFGTTGAQSGEQTYYWDDLKFGAIVSNVNSQDAAANNILIYPNPAGSFFSLEFPEVLNESVQIQLFDITGKMVYAERIQSRVPRIETNNLNNGTYLLRINTNNGSYFQKVMLVK